MKIRCVACGSPDVIRSGVRHTTMGDRQRWQCKRCGKRFVVEPLSRQWIDVEEVAACIELHLKGYSYGMIASQLGESKPTVWRWVTHTDYIWFECQVNMRPSFRCEKCGWGLSVGKNYLVGHSPQRERRYDICSMSCLHSLVEDIEPDLVFYRGRHGFVKLTNKGMGMQRLDEGCYRYRDFI